MGGGEAKTCLPLQEEQWERKSRNGQSLSLRETLCTFNRDRVLSARLQSARSPRRRAKVCLDANIHLSEFLQGLGKEVTKSLMIGRHRVSWAIGEVMQHSGSRDISECMAPNDLDFSVGSGKSHETV